MSARLQKLLPLLIIGLCVFVAWLLYLNRPEPLAIETKTTPLLIDVATVSMQSSTIIVNAQGNVRPRTQTTLISRVSGEVIEISNKFIVGGFFNKGDTLVRVEDHIYRAAVMEAKAQVASAESSLAEEKGRAEIALREWNNTGKRNTSVAAKALFLRQPQLAEAEARINSAKAQLQRAQYDLKHTTIVAPYTGLIKAKHTDIGQYLTTGATIAETYAVDIAEVRLAIPSDRLHYLRLPSTSGSNKNYVPPVVTLSANIGDTEYQWEGKLVRSEGALDERSRVLYVVAQIDDPYGLKTPRTQPLRIGTFVDANIEGRVIENLVPLPRYLLRTGNNIWVVENNQLRNRQVSILRTSSNIIYVSEGLKSGDKISLASIPFALPGTRVTENRSTTTAEMLAGLSKKTSYKSMGELLFNALDEISSSANDDTLGNQVNGAESSP